ncbi:MAG: hypothetical protein K8L97_28915 [Anaerolineae bacterium]|nr:hypothetical protein [Anaerolineae bacterium]
MAIIKLITADKVGDMFYWFLNWVRGQRQRVMQDTAERLLVWQQNALMDDDCDESKKHRKSGVLVYT